MLEKEILDWSAYIHQHLASFRSTSDLDELREEALAVFENTCAELTIVSTELGNQASGMEQTLEETTNIRRRHNGLLSLMRDGVLETDASGTIREASDHFARLLNIRAHYLAGKPLVLFVAGTNSQVLHNALRRVQTEEIHEWPLSLQPRGGPPIPTLVSALRLDADNHKKGSVLWLFREPDSMPKVKER
jgi:signal transduction histidine kinase